MLADEKSNYKVEGTHVGKTKKTERSTRVSKKKIIKTTEKMMQTACVCWVEGQNQDLHMGIATAKLKIRKSPNMLIDY